MTRGTGVIAWLDHGPSKRVSSHHYMVLLKSDERSPEQLATYAEERRRIRDTKASGQLVLSICDPHVDAEYDRSSANDERSRSRNVRLVFDPGVRVVLISGRYDKRIRNQSQNGRQRPNLHHTKCGHC